MCSGFVCAMCALCLCMAQQCYTCNGYLLGSEACSAGRACSSPPQREPCACAKLAASTGNAPAAQTEVKHEALIVFLFIQGKFLHASLQVANFERCECSHVQSREFTVVYSHMHILYKGLCFCVHYCTVLYRVDLYFKPRTPGSKCVQRYIADCII